MIYRKGVILITILGTLLFVGGYFLNFQPGVEISEIQIPTTLLTDILMLGIGLIAAVSLLLVLIDWYMLSERFKSRVFRKSPQFLVKAWIVNNFSSIFPEAIYDWPNIFVFLTTVLIVSGFILLGSSEIVIVTAFYTSVLFLNALLKVDLPRFRINRLGRSLTWLNEIDQPDPELEDYLDDIEEMEGLAVIRYQTRVTNVGTSNAKNMRALYRVFDEKGLPIHNGWRKISRFEDGIRILEVDDNEQIKFIIDKTANPNESEYFLYFKIIPSFQHRQLTYRKIVAV